MRVLIGCECSGVVRRAFRARGHDAWSCDLKPADDGSEFHIVCDLRGKLSAEWDLLIAHPDCRYLSGSGLHWNGRREGRAKLTEDALDFVRELLSAPIQKICIENPVGCISTRITPADQYIQPYWFGDDASKKTGLWLKGLPLIVPPPDIFRCRGRVVEWPRGSGKMVERWSNQTDSGQNKLPPSANRSALRAETYPGIAQAMAEQWGGEALSAREVMPGTRRNPFATSDVMPGEKHTWTLADDPDLAAEVREDRHEADCERADRADQHGE